MIKDRNKEINFGYFIIAIAIIFISALIYHLNKKDKPEPKPLPPTVENIYLKDKVYTNPVIDTLKSDLFTIVSFNSAKGKITKIELLIPTEKVSDYVFISNVTCQLSEFYKLAQKAKLSFYSEIEIISTDLDTLSGKDSYLALLESSNWYENKYLGDYNYKTQTYSTFPKASEYKKRRSLKLTPCQL